MIAPSINFYKGTSFQVKLPQDIFLSNYSNLIQSIEVDFQDGQGYRTISFNQTLNVSYSTANTYVWKFRLTLTTGQQLLSHSEVIIEEGLKTKAYGAPAQKISAQNIVQNTISDEFERQPITASKPFEGRFGTATLFIRDLGDDGIRNPLIIVEGFDTGGVLNPEQEGGDNNIEDFLESVENGTTNFELTVDGYDIIYVDWDNGVDFIQRNAYVLEEAIKWINDEKQSNGSSVKNVILAQSMGGLVARYALVDIEEDPNLTHDTELFISHDSPHLGANTPISLQHFNRHVKKLYQRLPVLYVGAEVIIPAAFSYANIYVDGFNNRFGTDLSLGQYVSPSEYLGVSDFPASRQMLYQWVAPDFSINNSVHEAWQLELSTTGYPQGDDTNSTIRNISVANGSECGNDQPGSTYILKIDKDAADKTIANAIIGFTDIGVAVGLALGGNLLDATWLAGLAVIPGNSSYDIDFKMRPMTTLNQRKQIYSGRITYKKKILWFIPVNVDFTNETKNQPNNVLPYDSYGGGWFDPGSVLDNLPSFLENFITESTTTSQYSFIPTASALDAGKGLIGLNDSDYRRSYVGGNPPTAPKDVPFDNFVSHFDPNDILNTNSSHISFDFRNSTWLNTEMIGNSIPTSDCSFFCDAQDISINGPSQICSSTVFTLSNSPTQTVYNWSISSPGGFTLIPNGSSVTVIPTGSVIGSVTLTATLTSSCGTVVATKDILGGAARPVVTDENGDEIGVFNFCNGYYEGITFDNSIALEWEWTKVSGNFTMVANNSSGSAQFFSNFTTFGMVEVRRRDSCGWSAKTFLIINFSDCSGGGNPLLFSTSPNPADNVLVIDIAENQESRSGTSKFENRSSISYTNNSFREDNSISTLYNQSGIPVMTIQPAIGGMNVSGLPTGHYLLVITYGEGETETHHILVK